MNESMESGLERSLEWKLRGQLKVVWMKDDVD